MTFHGSPILTGSPAMLTSPSVSCAETRKPRTSSCEKELIIVRPQLEYAAPVWDLHTQDDINKIEMVQRRAARWVLNDYSPYSSVSDMLEKHNWPTLEQRRADSRLVLFYKIIYGYVAVPLPTYVIPLSRTSRRTTH